MFRNSIVLLVLFSVLPGCATVSTLPLIPDDVRGINTNLYRIPVEMNGNIHEEFLIDTGSTYTGVRRKTLEKINAVKTKKLVTLFFATGEQKTLHQYLVSSLKIGVCTLQDVHVIEIPDDEDVISFLGFDVFMRLLPIRINSKSFQVTC